MRMTIIKKARNNKCWQGYRKKETLTHCWWKCEQVENTMDIPQKIKNRTTICSSYSTSRFLSKEYESNNAKRYTHPYIHDNIIYNGQDMETT